MEDPRISPNMSSNQYLVVNDDRDSLPNVQIKQRPSSDQKRISKKEWITVIILCFVNLINYMDRFTIPGVLGEMKEKMDIKDDESGLLQTAFIVSYMIFAPLFGYMGDRYSRKYIMSFGVFLWCLTTFIGSYMETYGWFLLFRAFVGVGEASYSTIAPTIISDLFVKDVRSKMLAMFYFAIPVGSGLGYIVGGETARLSGNWQWGLRVTPVLGVIAVTLILMFIEDPVRGEKEGGAEAVRTTWLYDVKTLIKNKSFMLSTAGFTCVSFVAGALAWFGPNFIEMGLKLQAESKPVKTEDVAFKFGLVAMMAGLVGVPLGSMSAQKLRVIWQQADPLICAVGLLFSSPFIFFAIVFASSHSTFCYGLMFCGQVALNLNWSIVADILLYVVVPTRRSTAEAFQILFAHALGDAGSPYLVGVISESLKTSMTNQDPGKDPSLIKFQSLQYALFITIFVEVLGGLFFLLTALYIQKDKNVVDLTIADFTDSDSSGVYDEEIDSEPHNSAIKPD